jgi:hypothetical protein
MLPNWQRRLVESQVSGGSNSGLGQALGFARRRLPARGVASASPMPSFTPEPPAGALALDPLDTLR